MKTVFIIMPHEKRADNLQRTRNYEQDRPVWEIVKEAKENESFMEFYVRGGRGVLISDIAIYTVDDVEADELVFETFGTIEDGK